MNIPVCIPTYKHPSYDFIDRVIRDEQFKDETFKHPLYYFIYDIDWESFNFNIYNKYFDELHFVKVPYAEYKTAMRMRLFIQEFMEKYDFYFLFDNDARLKAQTYNFDKKRVEFVNINEFLDTWQNMNIQDYAITKPCSCWNGVIVDKKPTRNFKHCHNPYGAILINNKLLKEHGIKYTGDINVAEDMEIGVNCLKEGLKLGEMTCYSLGFVIPMSGGPESWYKLDELVTRTYNKLSDSGYLIMKQDKKGRLKLSLSEERIDSLW